MRHLATLGLGLASLAFGTGCDPAIARIRGTVVSVEKDDAETEICVTDAVEAGSSYARDRILDDPECWSGIVDDDAPVVGDCVRLTIQGESASLGVERVSGCG